MDAPIVLEEATPGWGESGRQRATAVIDYSPDIYGFGNVEMTVATFTTGGVLVKVIGAGENHTLHLSETAFDNLLALRAKWIEQQGKAEDECKQYAGPSWQEGEDYRF